MNVKRICLFLASALLLCGCSDDDNLVEIEDTGTDSVSEPIITALGLSLSSTDVEIDNGGTVEVDYVVSGASSQAKVTATAEKGWKVSVKSSSTTKGTITITAPDSAGISTVEVTAADGDNTVSKYITLYPELHLVLSAQTLLVPAGTSNVVSYTVKKGSEDAEVTAAVSEGWTAVVSQNTASSGTVTVTAPDPFVEGQLEVTVKDGDKSVSGTVSLVEAIVNLTDDTITLDANKHVFEVGVTSNTAYRVSIPEDCITWVYYAGTKAELTTETETVIVDENYGAARSAEISLVSEDGGVLRTISVNQEALKFDTELSDFTADVEEGSYTYSIDANIDYTFKLSEDAEGWLSASMSDNEITFTMTRNLADNTRSAVVSFISKEWMVFKSVSITQDVYAFIHGDIVLTEAGTLESEIAAQTGAAVSRVTSLCISGPINGTDVLLLRKMINEAALRNLVLSGASITEGGVKYYEDDSHSYGTSSDVIGAYMFYGCADLEQVVLPSDVTSIGSSAFRGCSSLASITLSDGLMTIGEEAFYGCSSLTSIAIQSCVTSIGS